jgi:biopolymer transport protein ExbB/TolQ
MTKPTTGRNLAIAGAACQLGPSIGLAGTVIGMMGVFDTLDSSGLSDPSRLNESISQVLISTEAGLIIGTVGLILFTVSLTGCRYRAEWFFWFLVIYGFLALFAFPVGTAFGVFFLVYCLTKRHEFLRSVPDTLQTPPSQL